MPSFLSEYLPILIFIFIALGIAIGMTAIPFLFGKSNPDSEKLSAYECGFEAFDDARGRFDVRFYLVAILFNWDIWILVNDVFFIFVNNWFYL